MSIIKSCNGYIDIASNLVSYDKKYDNIKVDVMEAEKEELNNMIKYQNAYNLASKMIQTFTEIYDRLILETGV